MKDSSVGPAGLFDTRRQKRLLEGLAERFQTCLSQQGELQLLHTKQRADEETQYGVDRASTTAECRGKRRDMLMAWDQAEEDLISEYESAAIRNRKELNRLGVVFRRKRAEESQVIERKVQARRQAVLEQYENRKNQPGQQKRKETKLIDESLGPIHQQLEWARALTIRRLDRLPEVPKSEDPEDDMREADPDSVQHALEAIERLTRKCNKVVGEMQTGAASKIVDSFYLPAGVGSFVLLWAVVAFFVAPKPPWLWMAAGIIPAGVLGFTIYLILLWPLKRMTRQLYPQVERLGQASEACAAQGKKISAQIASDTSAELIQRRDAHIEAAERWQTEQIVAMETKLEAEQEAMRTKLTDSLKHADVHYTETSVRVGHEMRTKADALAQSISHELVQADQQIQQQRDGKAAERYGQLQHLATRLKDGVSRGLNRITLSDQQVSDRFSSWEDVLATNWPSDRNVDFLPLGWLSVDEILGQLLNQSSPRDEANADGNGSADSGNVPALLADTQVPETLPVVMHRRLHSGVVIQCSESHMEQALDLAHQILWRLLLGAPPSRSKLTLIDPLGRGQHFTSFMALADHDPSLVGHRVWTTDAKIEARLGELAHHVEDVLQASLRDRFERIEDYNQVAGSMAEPYRAVAAVGFPEGLSREGYRHLKALFESGLRCGIFTVLVCDSANPWPSDMPVPSGDKVLHLAINAEGQWHLQSEGLESLPFHPATTPPVDMRAELVERIGEAAVTASRVEIPLQNVVAKSDAGEGNTDDGIDIAIGSQGANRALSLDLGEGVRQHVLIAGKTGSGKSTLLHSIITSGAYHYRPDQLQFYLLDFKKGVEFKSYADHGLPHARVIGIESEREFGRSVLQRLDEELQHRGEKFRAAGVQELGEFRRMTGEPLPRIMLVVDEFQELFVRDDRLAGDCTMLLDRLVRQGRSFGMHVVLSSQSLAGAYSLPRATLGQMAVRIAMQCSESDAALILSDDNTAARLISRPGEAIYNDAGGLVEGNQPFQVAWLSSDSHRELLTSIANRDDSYHQQLPPPVVFEGNRPCRWTPALAEAGRQSDNQKLLRGLLGESVEIGPPSSLELGRDTGRNVLVITPAESRRPILASVISGMAKSDPRLEVIYFDGTRVDDVESLVPWLEETGIANKRVKARDCETEMNRLNDLIKERGDEAEDVAPVIVIVDPLERFRDLRQDDSFNFSLDSPGAAVGGGVALQNVLRDGPAANVFVFLVAGSAETLSRWLPRASQHDLELRIVGQMNQSDSALLIDSPVASDLSAATMLLYDDSDGRITKFRQCDLPDSTAVKDWLSS
ncbi:MAG: FtsK/SpoIIIE domain-containing protein [Rubripirellula sp.]